MPFPANQNSRTTKSYLSPKYIRTSGSKRTDVCARIDVRSRITSRHVTSPHSLCRRRPILPTGVFSRASWSFSNAPNPVLSPSSCWHPSAEGASSPSPFRVAAGGGGGQREQQRTLTYLASIRLRLPHPPQQRYYYRCRRRRRLP
ncbi:unnamed protein product [Ectocarpus sp. 6 AP-2014]